MAVTGQQALNIVLDMLDESGSTEYNTRAISAINALCDELYPISDNYTVTTAGKRPVCTKITALTDALPLDDVLSLSVLPYGLGSRLMMIDQQDVAANFEAIYQERIANIKGRVPAEFEAIEDVYGITDYSVGLE